MDVALELVCNVEDPDRRRRVAELFTASADLLNWTAFSLGARSAISTLDLCAAAAWRLSGGKALKGDREQDLDQAFEAREQLTPGPLRDWIEQARTNHQYHTIREFRHAIHSRLVARHIKIRLGEPTPVEIESQVGSSRQTAIAHLRIAAAFAVEQFSAFCDAAIEQFKR